MVFPAPEIRRLLASTVDAPELEEAGAFVFAFQVLPLTRNPTK